MVMNVTQQQDLAPGLFAPRSHILTKNVLDSLTFGWSCRNNSSITRTINLRVSNLTAPGGWFLDAYATPLPIAAGATVALGPFGATLLQSVPPGMVGAVLIVPGPNSMRLALLEAGVAKPVAFPDLNINMPV